jgi:SAM-dependent methyltransferase
MHAGEAAENEACLQILLPLLRALQVRSALDVGTATGRSLPRLADGVQDLAVCGVEPVAALVSQGISSGETRGLPLIQASGEALPFADRSFDAVCEFGVLHHVPQPSLVVAEMLRVAKKVVVIADSNRFGQGSNLSRVGKLLLHKIGLWGAFDYLRTKGNRFQASEGDGIFYSYSVYDNYEQVRGWAAQIHLFAIGETRLWSWFHPLLTSSTLLMIAVRKDS